jgi:hypothetical protein
MSHENIEFVIYLSQLNNTQEFLLKLWTKIENHTLI